MLASNTQTNMEQLAEMQQGSRQHQLLAITSRHTKDSHPNSGVDKTNIEQLVKTVERRKHNEPSVF